MKLDANWQNIRQEHLVYEDDAILAINKPAGISVLGERSGIDLFKLAREAGEDVYPVHRIDKVTSGIFLFAKKATVQANLTRQFAKRTVEKTYLAIVMGTGLPSRGTIDLPLMSAKNNRVRVAAQRDKIIYNQGTNHWSVAPQDIYQDAKTYPSVTNFANIWESKTHTLLVVRPITGRRHQIRVHVAWIGYPIDGDPLFAKTKANPKRTALHAWILGFNAEGLTGARLNLEAQPDVHFWPPLSVHPAFSSEIVIERARSLFACLRKR